MSGTVLENLSNKKLICLVSALIVFQIVIFIIGGIVAPTPTSVQTILSTVCLDRPGSHNDTKTWLYSRGNGNCSKDYDLLQNHDYHMANQLVFVFQMPLPREGQILDYSRWQQSLIGMLQIDIPYNSQFVVEQNTVITIDARLAYRNRVDKDTDWKYLAGSLEHRELECVGDHLSDGFLYSCSTIHLFELGSLHHDYYLLNIRLPVDSERKMNLNIGQLKDLTLTVIYQNGGYTTVMVTLKTIFLLFIISILVWFWKRIQLLMRDPALLEYMLISLGGALVLLNLPLELLTLYFNMPYMLLLNDIRGGFFYAILLSFWLVFAGEHMLIQDRAKKKTLKFYWRHLSAVIVGCLSSLIYEMCERGIKLRNPFYLVWVSRFGEKIAYTFLFVLICSAILYFTFLCYMVNNVFSNISLKKTSLSTMPKIRRIHYEGIIYRFKFLMYATLICAALTILGFVLGQMTEGQFKFKIDNFELEFSSAFSIGIYGMWNIYIFALLAFYAPSHKEWPVEQENIISEEIEFNNLPSNSNISEVSSLTKLAQKSSLD